MKITIEKCGNSVQLPDYKRKGDAGFDIRANNFKKLFTPQYDEFNNIIAEVEDNVEEDVNSIVINPGDRVLIGAGFKTAIPNGYEMQVRPRSGLAISSGVTVNNSPGTIDANYRGEIGVILINHGALPFTISTGDRIAQGVISKVETTEWVEGVLDDTNRGSEGFGSSGVK